MKFLCSVSVDYAVFNGSLFRKQLIIADQITKPSFNFGKHNKFKDILSSKTHFLLTLFHKSMPKCRQAFFFPKFLFLLRKQNGILMQNSIGPTRFSTCQTSFCVLNIEWTKIYIYSIRMLIIHSFVKMEHISL